MASPPTLGRGIGTVKGVSEFHDVSILAMYLPPLPSVLARVFVYDRDILIDL